MIEIESARATSAGYEHQRDEISFKGLIKRNKEIKQRTLSRGVLRTHRRNTTKSVAAIATAIAYHSGYLSQRFLAAISPRREPEVGAHSSFPVAGAGRLRSNGGLIAIPCQVGERHLDTIERKREKIAIGESGRGEKREKNGARIPLDVYTKLKIAVDIGNC